VPKFPDGFWYVRLTLHACTCILVITSALVLSDVISPAWLLVALFGSLVIAMMLVVSLCGIEFLIARMKPFTSWFRFKL
jgi:hypothetical protein